jgi:hypothetical protein
MCSSGRAFVGELVDRRSETTARIADIRGRLTNAETLAKGKACVFATGSFGRCEASPHSDLDVFVVGMTDGEFGPDGKKVSVLKHLDEICIMADLIRTTRELKIPDFSADGRYVAHFSVHEFTKSLGTPDDDVTNTFTARLLLLLESCPLLESAVYQEAVAEVIRAYWRDYEGREAKFMPAFLANDILRLWTTFCVNYEARTERVPDEERAEGKLHNDKLKHSRLLTCYSALLYLLAVQGSHGCVSPADAIAMVNLTPTRRLEWLLGEPKLAHAHGAISKLLEQYERFLETTNSSKKELVSLFMDKEASQTHMRSAYEFGDLVFEALTIIGNGSRFHRLLVV